MRFGWLFLLAAGVVWGRGTVAEFDPRDPAVGPFPTDFLTVPDARQRTGLRVNVPLPEICALQLGGDCVEIARLGRLDGFALNTRFTVKFSGAVRLESLRQGIYFVWLDSRLRGRFTLRERGHRTPVNEVVWNPLTNTAHGKPDEAFESSRRYLLVVTDEVRDAAGDPVEASEGFRACLRGEVGGEYCRELAEAVGGDRRIVAAAVYTTLSATAWMERAREVVHRSQPSFERGPVFSVASLRDASLRADVGGGLEDIPFPAPLALLAGSGVGRVAFGSIRSPRFLSRAGLAPDISTTDTPPVEGEERLEFHVWLPAAPAPPGGYPVIFAGHGLGDSRFGIATSFAVGMVNLGYAVVAMNAFGHGYGPRSTLRITRADGGVAELPGGGRGFDLNGDGRITPAEGCIIYASGLPVFLRDCLRQTAADWMQMTRHVRMGLDLDGDGAADLSRERIHYFGHSLGSFYGTLLNAVEPDIRAAALNAGGGSAIPVFLYGGGRDEIPEGLQRLRDAELPLRYEDVRVLSGTEAAAAQEVVARWEWMESVAAPASFAPHLKSATLPGVPVKRVLFQFAWGDRTVPNPASSQLVRAANLLNTAYLYRHDWARGAVGGLPENPHIYLAGLGTPAYSAVGFASQTQAARFFEAEDERVLDINPFVRFFFRRDVFEIPEFLPESLNY